MACKWIQLGIRFCAGAVETENPSAYIISTSDPFSNSLVESRQVHTLHYQCSLRGARTIISSEKDDELKSGMRRVGGGDDAVSGRVKCAS